MTQILSETSLQQPACLPVREEFGAPPDVGLMQEPEFRPVIEEVTTRLEATNTHTAAELETGEAAGRALKALGCAACELSPVCMVRKNLEERVVVGEANRELMDKVSMLASAPAWLTAARINQTGATPEKLATLAGDPEKIEAAIASGDLNLDELLGGTTNSLEAVYTDAGQLPEELQKLKNVRLNAGAQLEAQHITTKRGDSFIVIDATSAFPYKGEQATTEDYGILSAKLLNRMAEHDVSGKPQILSGDNAMQKPIKRAADGNIYELRMNGKNRMYIMINSQDNGEPDRITILGTHGGNAQTQREFIDMVTATH